MSPRGRKWSQTLLETGQRALAAILAAQHDNGMWSDFYIAEVGGISNTWVTAHVGLRLSTLPMSWLSPALLHALDAAAAYLLTTWRYGWGYNEQSPRDADLTAHALLFLRATGRLVPLTRCTS